MDPIFLAIAFVLGFAARLVGLPPMVGFLAAGFALNGLGFEGGPTLDQFADLGVTLLLFSIGLKLKIKSLLQPEVWAGASLHMVATVVVFGLVIFALSLAGIRLCFSEFTVVEVFERDTASQANSGGEKDGC